MEKRLVLDSQIRAACDRKDLDEACRFIQDLLDVHDGMLASVIFSGFDWDMASMSARMSKMREYVKAECSS